MRKTALAFVAAFCITLISSSHARQPVDPVNKDRRGIALKGYDPVAYFAAGKPAKGAPQFSFDWMGATWWFVRGENRRLFQANPLQYAPQYGGYCSWAVSQGYTADIDPEAWKVVDGKLYLNYNKSVQKKWEQDLDSRIEAANQNWPRLHK
jgi:YHS domain-containing protein